MMELLDTAEAARRVGLSRQTLAKYRVHGGGPPYVKLGARVLYRAADLAEWVAAHGLRRSTSDTPRPLEAA